jgi:hypothetical protein
MIMAQIDCGVHHFFSAFLTLPHFLRYKARRTLQPDRLLRIASRLRAGLSIRVDLVSHREVRM